MTGFMGTMRLNKMVILEIKSIDGLVIVEHRDQRAGLGSRLNVPVIQGQFSGRQVKYLSEDVGPKAERELMGLTDEH